MLHRRFEFVHWGPICLLSVFYGPGPFCVVISVLSTSLSPVEYIVCFYEFGLSCILPCFSGSSLRLICIALDSIRDFIDVKYLCHTLSLSALNKWLLNTLVVAILHRKVEFWYCNPNLWWEQRFPLPAGPFMRLFQRLAHFHSPRSSDSQASISLQPFSRFTAVLALQPWAPIFFIHISHIPIDTSENMEIGIMRAVRRACVQD
jgi:hypothetical protein